MSLLKLSIQAMEGPLKDARVRAEYIAEKIIIADEATCKAIISAIKKKIKQKYALPVERLIGLYIH